MVSLLLLLCLCAESTLGGNLANGVCLVYNLPQGDACDQECFHKKRHEQQRSQIVDERKLLFRAVIENLVEEEFSSFDYVKVSVQQNQICLYKSCIHDQLLNVHLYIEAAVYLMTVGTIYNVVFCKMFSVLLFSL